MYQLLKNKKKRRDKMGKQLLIIIISVMVGLSFTIRALSNKQSEAIKVNQGNYLIAETKHLAFTYAEIGIMELSKNFQELKVLLDDTEYLYLEQNDIENNSYYHAAAKIHFVKESDDLFVVKSTGYVTTLDKKESYTGVNQVKVRIGVEEYVFPPPIKGKHSFNLGEEAIDYQGPTLKDSVFWREGDRQIYIHRSSGRTVAEIVAGLPNYQWAILGVGINQDGSSFLYMDPNIWSELGMDSQNNTAQGMIPIPIVKYTMLLQVKTKTGAIEWREFTYVFERDTEFRTDNLAEILGVAEILEIASNSNFGENKKYNATFQPGTYDPMFRDEEVTQIIYWSENPVQIDIST